MDDDSFFDATDSVNSDDNPTACGILECLRMLAREAASLQMARTLDALRSAMTICAAEGDTGDTALVPDADDLVAPGFVLH